MAKPFKRSHNPNNNTTGGGQWEKRNLVTLPDSVFPYLSFALPKVTKENPISSYTFRILPSIEDGVEELALDPDANYSNTEIEECDRANWDKTDPAEFCGDWLAWKKVATPGDKVVLVDNTTVWNDGSSVEDWGPLNCLHTLNGKIKFEKALSAAGYEQDLMPTWDKLIQSKFGTSYRAPSDQKFIRIVLLEVNGVALEAPQYKLLQPPVGSMKEMLTDLTKRRDPSQPLSNQNNMFGDVLSCATGRSVTLSKDVKNKYHMAITDNVIPLNPADLATPTWEEIFYAPTVEQVVQILQQELGEEALDYMYKGTPYEALVPEAFRGVSSHMYRPKKGEATEADKFVNPKVQGGSINTDRPKAGANARTMTVPTTAAPAPTVAMPAAAPAPATKAFKPAGNPHAVPGAPAAVPGAPAAVPGVPVAVPGAPAAVPGAPVAVPGASQGVQELHVPTADGMGVTEADMLNVMSSIAKPRG